MTITAKTDGGRLRQNTQGLFNTCEACRALGVSRNVFRYHVRLGHIPHPGTVVPGPSGDPGTKRRYYTADQIEEFRRLWFGENGK